MSQIEGRCSLCGGLHSWHNCAELQSHQQGQQQYTGQLIQQLGYIQPQTYTPAPNTTDVEWLKGKIDGLVMEARGLYQENQALKKRVEELETTMQEVLWRLEPGGEERAPETPEDEKSGWGIYMLDREDWVWHFGDPEKEDDVKQFGSKAWAEAGFRRLRFTEKHYEVRRYQP